MSDVKGDYTVELEERDDGSPVYGEILKSGEDLIQFELYTPHQMTEGFDGESGSSVFEQEMQLAKQSKSGGDPEINGQIERTTELLVMAISAEDPSDDSVQRDLEPLLDWLHSTIKGVHYVDGIGFFDASGRI